MKILITADIHNGYPNRLNDTIWAMNKIYEFGTQNGIEKVIVLGDLFHNRSHITIDVLNRVFDFFKMARKDQEWIAFPGNHDMFMKESWDINSINPLSDHMNVIDTYASFSIDSRKFIVTPFMHFESQYMKSVKYIEDNHDEEDILLTHIGVNNAISNSCFLLKNWSFVNLSDLKFNLILTGHYHNYQVIDEKICYPGSPIPFKFDEGMVPHGFLCLNTDSLEVDFVDICGNGVVDDNRPPDFVTCVDNISNIDEVNVKDNKIRMVLTREYSRKELDDLRSNLLDRGAMSVTWMKKTDDEIDENVKNASIDVDKSLFEQWLLTKDANKYDKDLLISLHKDIAEDAEDVFIRREEDEDQ